MQISSTFFLFSFYFDLPTEVILSAILFPKKSPVISAVSLTTLFETVFAAFVPVFVPVLIYFLPYLSPNFIANDKKLYPLTYFLYFGSV